MKFLYKESKKMKFLCKESYLGRTDDVEFTKFLTKGMWYEIISKYKFGDMIFYEVYSDIDNIIKVNSYHFYTKQELRNKKLKKLKNEIKN